MRSPKDLTAAKKQFNYNLSDLKNEKLNNEDNNLLLNSQNSNILEYDIEKNIDQTKNFFDYVNIDEIVSPAEYINIDNIQTFMYNVSKAYDGSFINIHSLLTF